MRMQMLQGTARLGNDGCYIVLHDRQRGPHAGNLSEKVPRPVVWFSALQCGFGSLEFLFDGGGILAEKQDRRGIHHPQ